MGALAEVIADAPGEYRTLGPIAAVAAQKRFAALEAGQWPAERRAWRLWLEANWARNVGAFALAHQALDAAERVDGDTSYLLALEVAGLRAKLFQGDGEPGRAYPLLRWAMRGWLELGGAFADPTEPARRIDPLAADRAGRRAAAAVPAAGPAGEGDRVAP